MRGVTKDRRSGGIGISGGGGGGGGNGLVASPLSFSLMTGEGSAADLVAPDAARYVLTLFLPSHLHRPLLIRAALRRWADWTDGLNMLRRDGGHVGSEMTAGFVTALTEIGLKIKLLGAFLPWPSPHFIVRRRV